MSNLEYTTNYNIEGLKNGSTTIELTSGSTTNYTSKKKIIDVNSNVEGSSSDIIIRNYVSLSYTLTDDMYRCTNDTRSNLPDYGLSFTSAMMNKAFYQCELVFIPFSDSVLAHEPICFLNVLKSDQATISNIYIYYYDSDNNIISLLYSTLNYSDYNGNINSYLNEYNDIQILIFDSRYDDCSDLREMVSDNTPIHDGYFEDSIYYEHYVVFFKKYENGEYLPSEDFIPKPYPSYRFILSSFY